MIEFYKIPLEESQKPEDGDTVYSNRYWEVEDENLLIYIGNGKKTFEKYHTFSPQCNKNRSLVEKLATKHGNRVIYLETAFIPMYLMLEN